MSVTRSRPTSRARRGSSAVLALLGAIVLSLLGPASGAVAANYQYWGYWQLTNGAWTFSQQGPQQAVPADGTVEGWRWAIDDGSGTRTPRAKPTFEQLCGTTTAAAGSKRVGVLVDFGREADGDGKTAPPALLAKCAVVPSAATGAEVLAKVVDVRADKGMICGLQGYPASGCGAEVATLSDAQKAADTPVALSTSTPTAAQSAASASSGTSTTAVTVVAIAAAAVLVVVLLLVAARRRNRTTTS